MDTAELGGGNLYALALARHLTDGGGRAPVWCGGDGPAVGEAERLGLTVRRFDQARLRAGGFAGLAQLASVGWRLRRAGGLVHVHSALVYGFLSRAVRFARVRSVAHVHIEMAPHEYRWAFRQPPRAIVTCARFLAKQVEDALPEPARRQTRIVAVPNAVDLTRFYPGDRAAARSVVGAPADRPLVLLAANLAPHKGQRTAVRALALLREGGPDAELWLAGVERGGTEAFTEELKRLAGELGIGDRVRFLGQRKDMPDLMRAADAVVLPSTNEGLPLTLLEAQACGTPVLAAPTAGIPEIVRDGETGFLLAADDPAAYARRLGALLRDPGPARALADNALANVRSRHNIDEMFRQLRAVYDEVSV